MEQSLSEQLMMLNTEGRREGGGDALWIQPLLLSLLAGLSTCLGAASVFCLSRRPTTTSNQKDGDSTTTATALVRPAHMAFSLSLAGSVMVTVSFASLLPESLQDDHQEWVSTPLLVQRGVGFALGCALYALLSKCAFPEPDAILQLDHHEQQDDDDDEEEALLWKDDDQELGSSHSFDQDESCGGGPTNQATTTTTTTAAPRKGTAAQSELYKRQVTNSPRRSQSSDTTTTTTTTTMNDDHDTYNKTARPHNNNHNNNSRTHWMVQWTSGTDLSSASARRAWRVTMLLFVSLAVHNFPEGLAVAACTLHSMRLGVTTTVAIALHNIPEGIAIAIPCLVARPHSPCLAFGLASISGLFEPLGAMVALIVLQVSTNHDSVSSSSSWMSMDNVLAFVAGIMTTVAVLELFPEARRHSTQSSVPFVVGLVAGVVIMVGSELFLDSS